MDQFLRPTDVIDWPHPDVLGRAHLLADGSEDRVVVAKRCYEWVRDEIRHSRDFRLQPVTCTASEVLRVGSGRGAGADPEDPRAPRRRAAMLSAYRLQSQ